MNRFYDHYSRLPDDIYDIIDKYSRLEIIIVCNTCSVALVTLNGYGEYIFEQNIACTENMCMCVTCYDNNMYVDDEI